jgi:pilus assembly protein TadC
MIFGILESFNDTPLLLYLFVIAIACIGGGIPPMLERRRRRAIENELPTFLESLADSVGAGRGLQEAMKEQSEASDSPLPMLLRETLQEGHASSFEASLAAFAAKTRSSQVQRVMMLIETALQQDSSLRDILGDLSRDYERLNDLMNRRESELQGRGMLIIIFVSIGLPVLIAFIVGLFAPASKGFQIASFNQTFSLFFAAASAVGVGVSGRMMGRLRDTLWWLPLWMALSMGLYLGAVKAVGG